MDNQTIIIVLTVLGSVYMFYLKVKKDIINEQNLKDKPIKELNNSMIELTSSIKFLNLTINSLKERVTNHGKEIDDLKIKTENQEVRIKTLENQIEPK